MRLGSSGLAGLLLAGLALGACTPVAPPVLPSDRVVRQPVDLVHQVQFAPASDQLEPSEAARLARFMQESDPVGDAVLHLDATGPLAAERRAAVRDWLAQLGRAPTSEHEILKSADTVTLTLRREVLVPAACLGGRDGWPADGLPPSGCANALALLSMVERPEDLEYGREMGPAMAGPAVGAAQRYYDWQARPPAADPWQ
jgi:type IV pilus biogenesis protein CpaD/CtpE